MDFHNILLASDFDGTFWGGPQGISDVERNIRAIERFRANGGVFTFATGRILPSLLREAGQYGYSVGEMANAPVSLCNGAYLYDFASGQYSCDRYLDMRALYQLMVQIHKEFPALGFRFDSHDMFYCSVITKEMEGEFRLLGERYYVFIALDDLPKTAQLHKCALMHEDSGYVARAYEYIGGLLAQDESGLFELSKSSPLYLDITAAGTTKAAGVRSVAEALGRPKLKTAAIGDHGNDEQMLAAADFSCAPADASEEVRRIAQHIVCPCKEGAVAEFIEILEGM